MKAAGCRTKGANGEREVLKILEEWLGWKLVRNAQQAGRGGRDIIEDVDRHQHPIPFSIEVKRQEREELRAWWAQACDQAKASGRKPVLFYRANHKPWRVVVDAHDVDSTVWPERRGETITMELPTALQWLREVSQ